jgi:hypothetical protein
MGSLRRRLYAAIWECAHPKSSPLTRRTLPLFWLARPAVSFGPQMAGAIGRFSSRTATRPMSCRSSFSTRPIPIQSTWANRSASTRQPTEGRPGQDRADGEPGRTSLASQSIPRILRISTSSQRVVPIGSVVAEPHGPPSRHPSVSGEFWLIRLSPRPCTQFRGPSPSAWTTGIHGDRPDTRRQMPIPFRQFFSPAHRRG